VPSRSRERRRGRLTRETGRLRLECVSSASGSTIALPARMRSVATCFVTLMETTTTVPSTTYTTLTFSVYVYVSLRTSMYIYVSVLVNPSMIPICLARLRYLQPCRLFSKQSIYIYIKNMTPLQQRVRKTKKTPHSDTKTAPPPMTTDDDTKTTFTSVNPRVRKTKKTPHGVDASGHRARAYLDGC
jgi:hypothetical protein